MSFVAMIVHFATEHAAVDGSNTKHVKLS